MTRTAHLSSRPANVTARNRRRPTMHRACRLRAPTRDPDEAQCHRAALHQSRGAYSCHRAYHRRDGRAVDPHYHGLRHGRRDGPCRTDSPREPTGLLSQRIEKCYIVAVASIRSFHCILLEATKTLRTNQARRDFKQDVSALKKPSSRCAMMANFHHGYPRPWNPMPHPAATVESPRQSPAALVRVATLPTYLLRRQVSRARRPLRESIPRCAIGGRKFSYDGQTIDMTITLRY